MQRGNIGMRGYPRGGGRGSVKARLGVSTGGGGIMGRRNVGGGGSGVVTIQQVKNMGGGGIQRRLGAGGGVRIVSGGRGGIKARLGGRGGGVGVGIKGKRSVAALAIGEILDARQKINLSRVQSGRIGDARQKIEDKRRKNSLMNEKIKNLRIVAPVGEYLSRGGGGGSMDMGMVIGNMNTRSRPQGLVSRSEREAMGYEGVFRSAVEDTFSYAMMRQAPNITTMSMAPPTRITRSVGGGGGSVYPPGMRIAPSQQDDFVLTRTIRNPTVSSVNYGNSGGGGGMRSDYHFDRSPPQRVAPNVQYGSQGSYSRSSLREQAMDMDDDMYDHQQPPPARRSEYHPSNADSQCRILVSNLQPSVTADDIVELFSDIGPLTGARMTASGQAEVTYSRKTDAVKAIEAYHNRLLDGSAMRVFLDSAPVRPSASGNSGSYTALKSASGASMKLPAGKSSTGLKIQPDIQAIHKVLFNPGSSATRGLFKGGQ